MSLAVLKDFVAELNKELTTQPTRIASENVECEIYGISSALILPTTAVITINKLLIIPVLFDFK